MTSFSRLAHPQAAAGRLRPALVAGASVLLLVFVFASDALLAGALFAPHVGPAAETFGALNILVVLAAGWLLSPLAAYVITGVALALRAEEVLTGIVHPLTAAVESATLPVAVVAASFAARNAFAVRESMDRARGLRSLTDLLDTTRRLVGSSDGDAALQQVVEAASKIIPLLQSSAPPRAALLHIHAGAVTVVTEQDPGASTVGLTYPLDGVPPLRRVVEEGKTETFRAEDYASPLRPHVAGTRLCSSAVAPVRVAGRRWGALALTLREEHGFTPDELALLEGMADLAGLAIGNAEAVHAERTRSEELRTHVSRMAELEAVKADFLNLASHELRGPITVASGYVSMVEDGTLGDVAPPVRRVLPIVARKLREMNGLVNHMLEVARLEDGRLRLQSEPFNLSALVEETLEMVVLDAGGNRSVTLAATERLPIEADRTRVTTIVANLIDNALKYSPDDRPVHILCERRDGSADVSVTDEGFGIAPEHLTKLFTRFGRIVTPENSHLPGTGLGLYLCRQLARQSGGDITVVTAPKEGSTFTLRLPLAGAGFANGTAATPRDDAAAPARLVDERREGAALAPGG